MNKSKIVSSAFVLFFALNSSGCSTLTNGMTQQVVFPVKPNETCTVSQGDEVLGLVDSSINELKIQRKNQSLNLACAEEVKEYTPKLNAQAITSIMFIDFGLVDFLTGSAWSYEEKK